MALDQRVFAQLRDELLYGSPRVIELATVIGAAVKRVANGEEIADVCNQLRRERPHCFTQSK